MSSDFTSRVVAAIGALGPGEVATYGEIAEEAGFPRAARAVGTVLATVEGLPWWRVVHADGRLVAGHESRQAGLLRDEGVAVAADRVVPGSLRRVRA